MAKQSPIGIAASGVICCAVLPLLGAGSARADPRPDAVSANSAPAAPGVAEVIVTAEKHATVLERTAAAITAYNADQLDQRHITGVLSLQYASPGLFFGNLGATSQLSIRGVGANFFGGSPSVAVNIDGIFQGRDIAATFPFFDVDQVEVLNGPQGTLYGRNTTAGAINLTLVRPKPDLSVSADASYGNFGAIQFRGMVSGPLTADNTLMGLASFTTTKNDGYMFNIFDGKRQDFTNNSTGRVALLWEPDSTTQVYLSGTIFKGDDDSYSSKVLQYPATYYQIDPTLVNPASPWVVNENVDPKVVVSNYAGTLEVKKDVGPVELVSLSGYIDMAALNAEDGDQSPLPLINLVDNTLYSREFTQELRASNTDGGPFSWIAGLYWFHEHASSGLNLTEEPFTTPFLLNFWEHNDSYAVFGQGTYEVANGLRITGGLRGTLEDKSAAVTDNVFGLYDQSGTWNKNWTALTWKVGIEDQLDENVLVYGNVSRGFKGGGFNESAPGSAPYNPEYNLAYEVGEKGLFFDRKLQLNLSAFYYDYTNLQVLDINGLTMVSSVVNAAKATIYGGEISVVANPIRNLEIDASAAPLSARYGQFIDDGMNLQGHYLDRAPTLTFHIGAQYVIDLGSAGTLTPRIDFSWSSAVYFSEFNYPTERAPDSHKTDLNLRWSSANKRYYVEGFVTNLENDAVIKNILVSDAAVNSAEGSAFTYAPPRLFGMRVGYKY